MHSFLLCLLIETTRVEFVSVFQCGNVQRNEVWMFSLYVCLLCILVKNKNEQKCKWAVFHNLACKVTRVISCLQEVGGRKKKKDRGVENERGKQLIMSTGRRWGRCFYSCRISHYSSASMVSSPSTSFHLPSITHSTSLLSVLPWASFLNVCLFLFLQFLTLNKSCYCRSFLFLCLSSLATCSPHLSDVFQD